MVKFISQDLYYILITDTPVVYSLVALSNIDSARFQKVD